MSTQRGMISGLVTDEVGNSITGAIISSHRSLFKAETDENGHYEFSSLDVGTHRLTVEKGGYYLASKTVEIGYGQVLEGIDIEVEILPDMITWNLAVREKDRVVIDVNCAEKMSVWAAWREVGSTRQQTPPSTEFSTSHQIELSGLHPGAEYMVAIEGITKDNRRFVSEKDFFRTVNPLDIQGDPEQPANLKLTQTDEGPELSWTYEGVDSLRGFRVYRAMESEDLQMIANENMVFAANRTYVDDLTEPGRFYTYALQSVDLEGNVSSLTSSLSIVPAGELKRDLVWQKSWNPLNINGDITVPEGVTLTMQAGLDVMFSSEDESRSGFNPEICEFLVEGTLIAEGTDEEPISLTSNSSLPTRKDWDGLRIIANHSQKKTRLKNILISHAEDGIAIYDSLVEYSNIKTRFCDIGISLHGSQNLNLENYSSEDCKTALLAENTSDCSFSTLTISKAEVGIDLLSNSDLQLNDFDIRNSISCALKTADRENLVVKNGLLHSFETGLDAGGAKADYQFLTVDAIYGIVVNGAEEPVLKNNIIANFIEPDSGYGIEDKTPGRSYPYNNIYNFSQATLGCDQSGGPILNVDPEFIGLQQDTYDYHLKSTSPLLNAGENGGQPGAYGAPG
ncbi:MAG: carboxypeptidase regulatory-like domain-containing protein [Candidatus Rifleibacteriota bacterium]